MCESRNNETARLPSAFLACLEERIEKNKKGGRNLHDRTRNRVMDTSGMRPFYYFVEQIYGREQVVRKHQTTSAPNLSGGEQPPVSRVIDAQDL